MSSVRRPLMVAVAAVTFAVPAAMVGAPFGMAWPASLSALVLATLVWALPARRPSRGVLRGATIGALAHFPCWGLSLVSSGRPGFDELSPLDAVLTTLTFSVTMGAFSLVLLGWLTAGLGAGLGALVRLYVLDPAGAPSSVT